MERPKILPFYMSWPLPLFYEEEDAAMQDLEYFQEMYPQEAKRYQQKVSRLLDRFDYDGSAIYDEYPDRLTLFKMSGNIMETIVREEENDGGELNAAAEPQMAELIQVLVYHEIFKRRRRRDKGIFKF